MNTDDQSVDRILGALRDAVAPAGMEERILLSLEVALEARSARTIDRRAGSRPGAFANALRGGELLRWAPVAALAVVVVAVGISHYAHRRSTAAAPHVAVPMAANEDAAPPVVVSSHVAASQHRRNVPAFDSDSIEHASDAPRTEMAETAIISHPAPPMPPTEEEQLLLRFARRGRSQDLAQVSNERRAAQESREAEEFRAFFQPPVINGESE